MLNPVAGATAGFQTQVTYQPVPGIEGDFASANPRANVLAGPGALVAGPLGVIVGRFCWTSFEYVDANGAPGFVNNFGAGPVAGFLYRNQQGVIPNYLEPASMSVPGGFPITVHMTGDFWAKNRGSNQALPGMKAYANLLDGTVTFAAAGGGATASGSASSVAAATSSFTGSISGNVMTVTAVASGEIEPGTTISGTGVASGTKIVSQLTSTEDDDSIGGKGTYAVSIPEQDVDSTTISGTYGILTVGGTVTGSFVPGGVISGSGVVGGTRVTRQISGAVGGAGTYAVDNNTVVGSTAITIGTNVETKWYCRTSGLPGEVVKISSYPEG